ncbi:MAG: IS4 family transposase, partial [Betaproteobacteria bacterium]|nr:IS4 family transposase [Betaproteobacteria bacterium]
ALYTLLQILSVTLFEKIPLQQALAAGEYTLNEGIECKQLNLFTI